MAETYAFEEVEEAEFWERLGAGGWLLLDLYGGACSICTSSRAEKAIAEKYAGLGDFLRMDAGKAQGVVERYNLTSIPTLILFEGGKRRGQFVDVPDEDGGNVLTWLAAEMQEEVASPTG